jgi:hypothetical protein
MAKLPRRAGVTFRTKLKMAAELIARLSPRLRRLGKRGGPQPVASGMVTQQSARVC